MLWLPSTIVVSWTHETTYVTLKLLPRTTGFPAFFFFFCSHTYSDFTIFCSHFFTLDILAPMQIEWRENKKIISSKRFLRCCWGIAKNSPLANRCRTSHTLFPLFYFSSPLFMSFSIFISIAKKNMFTKFNETDIFVDTSWKLLHSYQIYVQLRVALFVWSLLHMRSKLFGNNWVKLSEILPRKYDMIAEEKREINK